MRILVIGDSISMGYTPTAALKLADVAEVEHNPGNGGDSRNVLANIAAWLADARPDMVCLNCGLHDVKRERKTRHYQVPLDEYRENLTAILDKIRAADCRLVWVTTTPVIDERHQAVKEFDRHSVDVVEYNAMARAIVDDAEITVIDLHQAALNLGLETALGGDGVHFTDAAYEALGKAVAEGLREHML